MNSRGVLLAVGVMVATLLSGCPSSAPTRSVQSDSNGGGGSDVPSDGRISAAPVTDAGKPAVLEVATGHPRLWVRADDLPRLRAWAKKSNKIYGGLRLIAGEARKHFDSGLVPSAGDCANKNQFCENYALLFAFMSLLESDGAKQKQWAMAARTVLMHMIDRVNAGADGDPLAAKRFSVHNRSRWAGEAFPLTVDWIYPFLSSADKAAIRKAFLRWAEEQLVATTTGADHPEPRGKLNDPVLLADRQRRRYGANNYFTAHMRNLGLMAMALDEGDDPIEADAARTYPRLRDYLANATGAWLYMTDSVLRNEARGGLAPEGFEYAARTLAFISQFYLGLQTAGQQDRAVHGDQVFLEGNPFFAASIPGFLHTLSPKMVHHEWRDVYLPAWYGDGESYELVDYVDYFAPLGIYARNRGDQATYDACRWIVMHTPPGGASLLEKRARAGGGGAPFREAILYFLLFDPDAKAPRDPRQQLPLHHFSPGLGMILARDSWKEDATWFQYQLGWAHIDHQHGDGNNFGLYRKGEWLLKERVGYGGNFEATDQHNSVAVGNSRPNHSQDARRGGFWKRGSQWVLSHDGDGKILAKSIAKDFIYVLGDATAMYNSSYENVGDVKHVSRSLLWIRPDHIVIYDRAVTGSAKSLKRFWLHTEAVPKVVGNRATAVSKGGQTVHVTTLLPAPARIEASAYTSDGSWDTKPARHEPMGGDLMVELGAPAKEVRFLHVIQVGDGKVAVAKSALIESPGGLVVGAMVGDTAVVFPARPGKPLERVTFTGAGGAKRYYVTGLVADQAYRVDKSGEGVTVEKDAGAKARSDSGGVLVL